jgi:serine/threonine protein kinase
MRNDPTNCGDLLSPTAIERIDEVCDRFEAAWRAGQWPRIEDSLGEAQWPERPALLGELLVLDLAYRRRRGEQPAPEEYRLRFPEHSELIRRVYFQSDQRGFDSPRVPATTGAPACLPPAGYVSEFATQERVSPDVGIREEHGRGEFPATTLPASIGKYRVVEQLGQGGQAVVFRAVHPNLPGRDVVIKWSRQAVSPPLQRKVIDEARILARLEDPGIVRIYDADVHDGRPFLVLEHLAGCSLSEQLKREGLPRPRDSAALVARLARTLTVLHQHGVVHLDLKPANILIDATGAARLVDFGLAARVQAGDEPAEPEGPVSGTLNYMAPEQAWGRTYQIGPRTDLFGLGAVLYELLTGRPPYRACSRDALLAQARLAQVIRPRQVDPRIPRPLERICLKALARDPAHRYTAAAHMERALRSYLWRRRLAAATPALIGLLIAGTVATSLHSFSRQSQDRLALDRPKKDGAAAVKATLDGELTLRVGGPNKPGLNLDQTGALPVRNVDGVHLEVQLNQPAFIYLLWIDSRGRVQPLYPWQPVRGFAEPPGVQTPRRHLDIPPKVDEYSPMDGAGGLETALLLARHTPLPLTIDLARLVVMPSQGSPSDLPGGQVWKQVSDLSSPRIITLAQHRALKTESRRLGDPLVQLFERLRPHFDLIEAVRFAYAGD